MVSRLGRQVLGLLSGIAVLGAVPGTGFSQSESERVRIAEAIRAAEAKNGPRSADLIQPLTDLSQQYETEGRHALATAAVEQARQIVRANYGLHTLDQVSLIEQALENEQALGNLAMVEALEEELFDLARRHPADLRAVAIHRDLGARRMNLLRRFLAGEAPPEIYPEVGWYSFTRDDVVSDLVSDAQSHYADAAAVLLRNDRYSSDELRDLELSIVRAGDVIRQRNRPDTYALGYRQYELQARTNTLWDLAGSVSSHDADQRRQRVKYMATRYHLGRESYRRLIAYDETVSGPAPADGAALARRARAHLDLADWDLLHSANGVALDEYARVHEMLSADGQAEPLIEEIFAPPMPVVLPAFLPNPLETETSDRHIDVTFEVTRYGEGRRVEILGATPDVSAAAKNELASLIKSSRFRPRVTDGEVARASLVVVRYYVGD